MSKKGDVLWENLIYLFILILFLIPTFILINSNKNGAASLEDFYSKEIAGIINNAETGMEFKIDVTSLASLASENSKPLREVVSIDNVNNEVIVSTRLNGKTTFKFFNDLDIIDFRIESPSLNAETTRFIFKTKEKQRNDII